MSNWIERLDFQRPTAQDVAQIILHSVLAIILALLFCIVVGSLSARAHDDLGRRVMSRVLDPTGFFVVERTIVRSWMNVLCVMRLMGSMSTYRLSRRGRMGGTRLYPTVRSNPVRMVIPTVALGRHRATGNVSFGKCPVHEVLVDPGSPCFN